MASRISRKSRNPRTSKKSQKTNRGLPHPQPEYPARYRHHQPLPCGHPSARHLPTGAGWSVFGRYSPLVDIRRAPRARAKRRGPTSPASSGSSHRRMRPRHPQRRLPRPPTSPPKMAHPIGRGRKKTPNPTLRPRLPPPSGPKQRTKSPNRPNRPSLPNIPNIPNHSAPPSSSAKNGYPRFPRRSSPSRPAPIRRLRAELRPPSQSRQLPANPTTPPPSRNRRRAQPDKTQPARARRLRRRVSPPRCPACPEQAKPSP